MNDQDLTLQDFYKYTVKMIDQENTLINNRLSWMLTFQGFLFATLALIASKDTPQSISLAFRNVVPIVGIVVAFLALLGVFAAYISIDNTKRKWKKRLENHQYPPAHGTALASILGRITSYGIPISLILAWFILSHKLTALI